MKSISLVTALLAQSFVPAPFAVSLNNCTFTDVGLSLDFYMLKPSEIVACSKKVQINSTNFKHHVQHMNDIFANNDGLYYTSVDPMKNLPLNYQEDLGYSVYHGETEGQVDLKSELNKLIAKIDQKGFADASQFWEMNKIFQMLKDGHVYSNLGTPLGQLETNLIGSASFVILSFPRNNNEDDRSYTYSSKFSLIDNEIILSISEGDEGDRKVLSIGDITPHDFLIKLANVSGISADSKDLGANVNAIINNSFNLNDNSIAIFGLVISPDVFADDYLIKYDDGGEEMLLSRVEVPIAQLAKYEIYSDMLNGKIMLDASSIEEDINFPGKLFKDSAKSFSRFKEVRQCTPNFNRNLETNNENIESRKMDESHNEKNTFRLIGWPYYIYDSYTVLQLNTFQNIDFSPKENEESFQSIVEDWNLMVSKSPSKKLIIDVSNNGGGVNSLNQLMTKLLFPTVNTTYLKNYANAPYNDMMDAHLNVFMPLANAWQNVTAKQVNEYINLLDVESLCHLEESYDLFWNLYSEELDATYQDFFEPLQSFVDEMSVETFLNFTESALGLVEEVYNPLTAQGLDFDFSTEPEFVIRGGKEIKQFTNIDHFAIHYEAEVPDYVQQHVDSSSSFDEYVILSNGVCGSSCDQLVTTSMQVWRNRNVSQSKQPVHVVTYGGLGKPIDPSQWAAGYVVSPKVHFNYGPYLGLSLLWDATGEIKYFNAATKYEDVMPNIPYYANAWPGMSATELYSNFMMPTGIPIDYLKKKPDHHIPEMFVPFEHSVYVEASKHFATTSDAMSSAFKHHDSLSTCMVSIAMIVGFFFML